MSANERGLGRGLDALFRNVTPAERPSSAKADSAEVPAPSVPKSTTTLPIAALTPCKGQPRKHFDEAALDELAASIRSQGVIQPLLVRPRRTETATIYEIVAGERVLVVGDIMLDAYLIGDADRISPEAPVPVVRIEKERYLLGGAGNVARNIVALGGVATLAGVMGKDASADRIRGLVRDEGICGAFVALPQRPTTVKTRVMARRQQMLRLDSEDASPLSSADQEALLSVITEQLPAHDVVILSDYSKGIVSLSFMSRLRGLLAASPHQVKVLIDPKPSNVGLYGGSFLLTPNTKETGECAGMPVRSREEILAAGRAILEKVGCPHLLTTLGSDGMALFSGPSEVWHVPTMAQDVFDVTGAGDTVIATLGLGLAAGLPLLASCVLANYAAGLVVAQVGAAVASPDALREAIRELPVTITKW